MNCTPVRFTTKNSRFSWDVDDDGFLRCKTTVLKSTVLDYKPDQIGEDGIPDSLKDRRTIALFVPKEELAKTESLDSLEGKPVSVDHIWQEKGNVEAVGNIAGKPFFDEVSGLLHADILITDPEAIARITSSDLNVKLVEQSAGYRNGIDWTPGVTDDGKIYDGIQRDIKYNHIALLPQGQGRAGGDVRILNKNGGTSKVSEFTIVRITNSKESVRILNEDVSKLESAMDEKDKTINEAMDPKNLEKSLQEIERLNNEIVTHNEALEKVTAERDVHAGQIEGLQTQLAKALDPELQKESLNSALADQESANKIINSFAQNIDDSKKAEIKSNLKALHGSSLHSCVVDHVRSFNKKDALTPAELENSDKLKGMFIALSDTSEMVSKNAINGAGVVKSLNKGNGTDFDTSAKRIAAKFKQAGK